MMLNISSAQSCTMSTAADARIESILWAPGEGFVLEEMGLFRPVDVDLGLLRLRPYLHHP